MHRREGITRNPTASCDARAARRVAARGRLRLLLELAGAPLEAAAGSFWRDPRLPRLYPRFLLEIHGILEANHDLLSTASRLAAERRERGAARLSAYLARHAGEERGHDAWVRTDLAALGVSAARVRSHVPSSYVAGLVGRQQYLMTRVHPAAVLGYVAVLEGFPASPAEVRAIGRRSGIPQAALRTLAKHAELDHAHRRDLDVLLDELPLSAALEALVRRSALATIGDLVDLFLDLGRHPRRAAA